MRICLVTSFPPSKGDLNEYGYHLARALQSKVELTILADEVGGASELPGFLVERCWRFNSLFNVFRLLQAIWKAKPDVVWFNIGFSTFARSPISAFLGATIPALTRLMGFYTHISLHTIFERIDLEDAGVRWASLYRMAGRIATRLLLLADDVSVLLPSFRDELVHNYSGTAGRVHFQPHGIFGESTGTPEPATDGTILLAFGYWGTYKRLELVLEALGKIAPEFPDAVLVVAGTNHPRTPGYLEGLQRQYAASTNVRFLGYVPEDRLRELFTSASVLVLPYSSAAGASGVVHQGCEYGLPMVAAGIPEIQESAQAEGIAVDLYPPGNAAALAQNLRCLLASKELRQSISTHNLAVASKMRLSNVVENYLALFRERVISKSEQELHRAGAYD